MKGLVRFARDHLGLELWPGQVEVLEAWAASGKRRGVLRLGRRSGKDVMAAVAAIKNATVDADDYRDLLRPGERRFALVVATRLEQAREFIRVVRELLDAAPDPDLRSLIDTSAGSSDEVVFRTGATIRAMPCSSRSTRGLPVSLAIFSEAAHMQTETEGFAAFRNVWRALVPSGLQFGPLGYVLVPSTPLWPSGHFHQLCAAAATGSDPDLFHAHRPTWEMNPSVSRGSLEGEFIADPEGAACEYGAEFGSGEGAFLDPVEVHACKRKDGVLPPEPDTFYAAAIDPAFARDAFALAIAHREADVVVVDGCWTWRRAGFERTLDEVVAIARRYGVRKLRTDQFSSQAVLEGLQKRGLTCDVRPWDAAGKWQAYSRLKALIHTRGIEIPNDPGLLDELVHLQASQLPSGQTRISAAAGHHDDRASTLAALTDTLAGGRRKAPTSWTLQRSPNAPLYERAMTAPARFYVSEGIGIVEDVTPERRIGDWPEGKPLVRSGRWMQ